MSISKIKRDIQLLEQQLEEIDANIFDPIERIELKKQLDREIKKLERSLTQIEQLKKEPQELESFRAECLSSDRNLVNEKKSEIEQYTPAITNNLNFKLDESSIKKTTIQETTSTVFSSQQIPLTPTSDSSNKSSIAWFHIKYIAIFGIVFSSVIATILIINFNSTQKAEQARLKELAKQEVERAKQETIKAQQEKQAAIRAKEEAEKARQEAIRAKEEAEKARQAAFKAQREERKIFEAYNQRESNISYSNQQKTVNLNNSKKQIDELTDRTFYSRYPELRGRKIRADETFLKQEWLKIRDCEATVDYLFYQRHPELGGRKIFSGEKNLAQEWLQIKRNTSGCN